MYLADFLGAELLLLGQVLAVVVSEVVVAGYGNELETGIDHQVGKTSLETCLTTLKVVATNESVVPLGQLDHTWDEGVAWGAVDVWYAIEDTSDGEDA